MKIKSEITAVPTAQRLFYLDWLKFVAIFMVLTIHVASVAIYNYIGYSGSWENVSNWAATIFYNSLGHCCIGIFFMISGVLLLNPARPQDTPRVFLKKRLLPILIPYLTWQILYFFWIRRGLNSSEILGQLLDLRTWISFVFYPAYYHLWYLQALIWVYLATPMLRTWLGIATKKNLEYILAVWLIMVIGGKFLSRWSGGDLWHFSYLLEVGGFYLLGFYFVYAWPRTDETSYLDKVGIWVKKFSRAKINFALGLGYWLAVLIIFGATWFFTGISGGQYDTYWENYISIPNIIAASCLFLWARRQTWPLFTAKWPALGRMVSHVAALSLGIYLIHVIFLEILRSPWLAENFLPLNGTWPNLWLGIPLIGLGLYFICYWLVKFIKLIPILRRIV